MRNGWKDRVVFVLVDPTESGNIGAAARAIKNMGFSRMRLVNPPNMDLMANEARWFAYGALDILENAERFDNLRDALADVTVAAATTRRRGKWRGSYSVLREAAPSLREKADDNLIAFVFGNERTGLTNEHLEMCGIAVTIPTDDAQPSLNLAQAVMVVAYEMSMALPPASAVRESKRILVTKEQMEPLWGQVTRILFKLGLDKRGNREIGSDSLLRMKQFVGRSGMTLWEMHALEGMCWQIERRLDATPIESGYQCPPGKKRLKKDE